MIPNRERHMPADLDFLSKLGHLIISCVEDAVIDRRMVKQGFRPQILIRTLGKHLAQRQFYPPGYVENVGFQKLLALQLFCWSARSRDDPDLKKDVEAEFARENPTIIGIAQNLTAELDDLQCVGPEFCFALMKRLRDILGFPVAFVNPRTNRTE